MDVYRAGNGEGKSISTEVRQRKSEKQRNNHCYREGIRIKQQAGNTAKRELHRTGDRMIEKQKKKALQREKGKNRDKDRELQ